MNAMLSMIINSKERQQATYLFYRIKRILDDLTIHYNT